MSPVQQTSGHATRALVLALAAVAVAVGALYGASVLMTNRHNAKVHEGEVGGVVTIGKVTQLARHINGNDTPTFYPDTSGNHLRDLYVQHVGTDPDRGWIVFAAQVPEEEDGCVWQWQRAQNRFRATCDHGKTLSADAAGVPHYPVKVDHGKLKVDLRGRPGQAPGNPSS